MYKILSIKQIYPAVQCDHYITSAQIIVGVATAGYPKLHSVAASGSVNYT